MSMRRSSMQLLQIWRANPLRMKRRFGALTSLKWSLFTAGANAVEDGRRVETPAFAVEDLISRIAALEQRVSEQDDALRRVISTMIDWMDKEGNVEARLAQKSRAA